MTRRPIPSLLLTLLLLALPGSGALAQEPAPSFPPGVAAETQAAMDEFTAEGLPPGMIAWIDAPPYRFEGASGLANLAAGQPMPTDGAFRIGSLTKMFTAALVMQLAEDGVLTLDDPLSLWLPEVSEQLPHGDQITLRHLLAHTSGVFNIVEHEAYFADIFAAVEVDEATGSAALPCVERDPNDTLARYVYGKDALFEPGSGWAYSNTNYALLGMVIEAATAMPLAEAYRARIYEPLGMASTFLDCYEDPLTDVVHGYSFFGETPTDVTELHESVGWAAGGLVSSAPDLRTFGRGLFGGSLFDDPTSVAAMMPAPGSPYGLGIARQGEDMGHAGWIAGFRSVLTYVPESDTLAIVLFNNDGADPELALPDVLAPVLSLLGAES